MKPGGWDREQEAEERGREAQMEQGKNEEKWKGGEEKER